MASLLEDPQIQAQLSALLIGVITLFFAVLSGLLTWASVAVKKWLAARADHAAFQVAADKIFHVTDGLVREAERTLVKEAKAATADGKLTGEEGTKIRDEVLKRCVEHLGLDGIVDVQKGYKLKKEGALEMVQRILRTAIEARIWEHKNGNKAA